MGVFKGRPWQLDDGTENAYMMAWGTVVEDAQVSIVNRKRVAFTIRTHRKVFQNCVVWGEGDASNIASSLEKDDVVLVFGIWGEREYTNKNGEKKLYNDLKCEVIISMPLLNYILALFSSPAISELLDGDTSDKFESQDDDDFTQITAEDIAGLPFR